MTANTTAPFSVTAATTAELVAFYNANAIKPVTKFADRKTAERRVQALLDDMQDTGHPVSAWTEDIPVGFAFPKLTAEELDSISNRVKVYNADLATSTASASAIASSAPTPVAPKTATTTTNSGAAISASFKLDRRTVCLTDGEEFKTAGAIWSKYGTTRMTNAQHDGLTAKLYGAAKTTGKRDLVVTVGAYAYRLV